ncbi:MAG: hypothetical protein JJU03_05635 [Idiomarina sp.]|nr:hypothetical protein [Idiomarina sp.]
MSIWLLAITFYPILLLAVFAWRKTERYSWWWIVSAPLGALAATLFAPDSTLQVPDLLFGLVWRLDDMSRPLLMMTSLLWLIAGLFAYGYMEPTALRRYTLFWLLTMVGNFALIMAQDIASFYTGFALMTFAGYGLVVHTLQRDALRAGKIYMIMAIMGEVMILAGFIAIIPGTVEPMLYYVPLAIAEHEHGVVIAALLFAGFGVKAGVLGLHFWLPLAHPVAPTPASAVLSGAMIKAGLIAWMQVLPLGADYAELMSLTNFAYVVIALGLAASFLAALLGVVQLKPKAVLAYSSISQMGLMTTMVGLALLMPALWPGVLIALIAFMVHHGLAKGALFLTVGLVSHPGKLRRWMILALIALPALSLIGVPLSSGGAAKYLLKGEAYETDMSTLVFLLTFAATATTLLMLRFVDLVNDQLKVTIPRAAHLGEPEDQSSNAARVHGTTMIHPGNKYMSAAVILSVFASLVLVWLMPIGLSISNTLTFTALWESAWPIAVAAAAYPLLKRLQR